MAPRKSTSKLTGTSSATLMPPPTTPGSSARASRSTASSSKVTLDAIPPVNLPETLTPGYTLKQGPARGLDEEQRGRMIHELVGFYPRSLCETITEGARTAAMLVSERLDPYIAAQARGRGQEYDREVDIGLYAFETLISNHVDKSFDKFTAWALRNTFDVPDDIEVVMPWCKDLDFERGAYVAAMPGGEDAIVKSLDELRKKVEQMRYLSQQLESAEKALDRRLEIARQRKAEVGFVQQVLAEHNLNPLAPSLRNAKTSLLALHEVLSAMPDPHPSSAIPPGQGQKAWEMGRQAYLAWAVGKAIAVSAPDAPQESLDSVEQGLQSAKAEDLERVMKSM